jgi:uncharacterized BrkB/YihY/UPF0761 family membrane protein
MATAAPKTWKATTAGILNIVAGGLNGLTAIGIIVVLMIFDRINIAQFLPQENASMIMPLIVPILIFVLVLSVITAVFPIIGGVFALRRRNWGWALAGSIIAIFRMSVLGILSTIFVSMAKDEFE